MGLVSTAKAGIVMDGGVENPAAQMFRIVGRYTADTI
jgi:hypothetical protein